MPSSVPIPLQAVLWPLVGAVLILSLGRFLPGWLGRLGAAAVTCLSLAALWFLSSHPAVQFVLPWTPANFFRMGPTLSPTPLGLFAGIAVAGFTGAVVLGIRSSQPQRPIWHALMLVGLSGCLVMTLAANALTLALGSAVIDLAFVAMAIASAAGNTEGQRPAALAAWCVPGFASTLLLVLAALQMDTQVGTASLLARQIPVSALNLIGIGGLLRLLVLPAMSLVDAAPRTPERAASLVQPLVAGLFLLARLRLIAPSLGGLGWYLGLGAVALLVGGWIAWLARVRTTGTELAHFWTGAVMHQAGLALVFVFVSGTAALWPLFSLTLALGILAIWWDTRTERPPGQRPARLERIVRSIEHRAVQAAAWIGERAARGRLRTRAARPGSWLAGRGTAAVPALALASLIGVPLTIGAVTRWYLYGILLSHGRAIVLLVLLLADMLLVGGAWNALRRVVREAGERRPGADGLPAMALLAVASVLLGLAPRILTRRLGLNPAPALGVSPWGLGLVFVLPWLLGVWLGRIPSLHGALVGRLASCVQASTGRLARGAGWAARRLLTAVNWLSRVGEGEGWWGWALIILALGALYWTLS